MLEVLHKALSLKRRSDSKEEAQFCAWLATTFKATMIDEAGNLHFDRRNGKSRTLFTAHSDTCHRTTGENKYTIKDGFYEATDDVLGADDAAGIAVVMHLLVNIPCYVIIFRGEEVGGTGSSWLAKSMPELLQEFDRAIAFDRADYYDVVTHQFGGRCASDKFADALAKALNDADDSFMYIPSDQGVFTDTANLIDCVAECTNLSVGYFDQHSKRERQNVKFLTKLADAAINIDWENLPTERKLNELEMMDAAMQSAIHEAAKGNFKPLQTYYGNDPSLNKALREVTREEWDYLLRYDADQMEAHLDDLLFDMVMPSVH